MIYFNKLADDANVLGR